MSDINVEFETDKLPRRHFMGLAAAASTLMLPVSVTAKQSVYNAAQDSENGPVARQEMASTSPKQKNSVIPCGNHKTKIKYRTVEIDGMPIFYREAGEADAPTILLLHGWPSSSFEFRELIPLLAENFHVVAPDYPGLGYSGTPPIDQFDYSFDNIAATLLKFTEVIEVARYALYITDFGGCIGWIMAEAQPERVTAIISQNGAAYDVGVIKADDAEWQATVDLVRDPTPERRQAMASALSFDYTKFTYVSGACDLSLVSPDTYHLDYALFQRPGQLDIQVELLISYAKFILDRLPEAQAYLRQNQPPLLVIWGANDPYYPKEGAIAFKSDVPSAEIHLYDAGHFAIETHLFEISEHITHFLFRRGIAANG